MNKNNPTPIANPSIVFREEYEDSGVLFDPDTGEMFGLNAVGMTIWKCLDGQHSHKDIIGELHQFFENVSEDAAEHVLAFIEALVLRGFADCLPAQIDT